MALGHLQHRLGTKDSIANMLHSSIWFDYDMKIEQL